MHAVYRNGKYEVKSSLFHFSCSSRQEMSARRIVVKRQVTVATLMVSSTVTLSSCVADIGTRSASEETTKVDEAGGISSTDGAGGTDGDPGDDVEGNQGESAHTNGGKNADGAGQPGEAGATGPEDTSGVLPPLGEFDPADPSFELFDPCTEIAGNKLESIGLKPSPLDSRRDSGSTFCNFESRGTNFSEGVLVSLASDSNSIDTLNLKEELQHKGHGVEGKQIQIYRSEIFGETQCDGYVSTQRGTVIVSVNDIGTQSTTKERCNLTASLIKQLS